MKIKRDCTIRNSNSGVLAYVAEHPEAIGYVSFAILNHEVKPLSINGVAPTVENAKQGMYPISRNLGSTGTGVILNPVNRNQCGQ